ncbi:fimbrial protein [Burkholderia ubonensis]|uniref:fimbrial protein n=1 Tax=Burkholderia ubonensis TaxID=101571 RepID=UPI000A88173A|nr:fimbrial protein [Burkholderia ubonensis]
MKFFRQLALITALGLCATHAFADGQDSAQIDFTGTIKIPGCTITEQTVPVKMGDIPISAFGGPNTKATPQPFKVSMTCPAGINNLTYQLNPSGTSQVVGDMSQGIVSLTSNSGASGIGVELMDDKGAPIPLKQDNPVSAYDPKTPNQQNITMNFQAAYIQTDANVKGGEADAQATFTLSYQ